MPLKWVGLFIAASLSSCACYVPVDLGDGGCDSDAGPVDVCTLGVDKTCIEGTADAGTYLGTCVQGPKGALCGCVYGFEPSPITGRCVACRAGSTAATCEVCVPGDSSTCAPDGIVVPSGLSAGSCVQTDYGPHCECDERFDPNRRTGRCEPNSRRECTTDESCNSLPTMSSLGGTCRSNGGDGTFCECNEGFMLRGSRCAPVVCWENKAGSCQAVNFDGSLASPATCGSMSIEPGCSCQYTVRNREAVLDAVCPPPGSQCPADGGTSRNCQAYNCGRIWCSGSSFLPVTCVAPDNCQ